MRVPKLKTMGTCESCKKTVEVEADSMCCAAMTHHGYKLRRCPGSGYSVWHHFYVIESKEKALEVAKFIRDDTNACLDRPSSGHSTSCNDGKFCEAERKRLSNALAVYFLALMEPGAALKKVHEI